MSLIKKQVLGFSNSAALFVPIWKNPLFLNLMLQLSGKKNPNICYVGAARGESTQRITEFYDLANRTVFRVKILDLYNMETDKHEEYFKDSDIIYIDGGSTRNLLALSFEWKLNVALLNAYQQGVLIAGASAGINCLFEWNMTDSVLTEIRPIRGLGMLQGSVCPHFDKREDRQTVFKEYLRSENARYPAYALEDGVAMYLVDGHLQGVYSLSPESTLIEFKQDAGSDVGHRHAAIVLEESEAIVYQEKLKSQN